MEQRPNRAKNVPKQRRLRHASWVALTLLLLLLLLPYLLVLYQLRTPSRRSPDDLSGGFSAGVAEIDSDNQSEIAVAAVRPLAKWR